MTTLRYLSLLRKHVVELLMHIGVKDEEIVGN